MSSNSDLVAKTISNNALTTAAIIEIVNNHVKKSLVYNDQYIKQ